MSEKRKYDSTVARIAGNIIGGLLDERHTEDECVRKAVRIARLIVVEVERTEPADR